MPVKLSVNLPDETVAQLKRLAEKRESTVTQVLKEAIATESFLDEERRQGKKILVKGNKETREIVFKY